MIGDRLLPGLPAIPAIELALGLAVGVTSSVRTLRWLRLSVASLSALVLTAFTIYILCVPSAVFARAGCGCHGPQVTVLVSGVSVHARAVTIATNALLLFLHFPMFARQPTLASSPVSPRVAH